MKQIKCDKCGEKTNNEDNITLPPRPSAELYNWATKFDVCNGCIEALRAYMKVKPTEAEIHNYIENKKALTTYKPMADFGLSEGY